MHIALVSPKGPLYRHGTGIFRRTLRAAPLTLTTLAALIPDELEAEVHLYDEGVETLPDTIEADLVGMTVITGSAPRAYELAARFRREGKTVVLGGPHITLMPEEAEAHADAIVTGYAEETWPRLLLDYAQGNLQSRYAMASTFSFDALPAMPFPHRHLLKRRAYSTTSTFEATRGCVHDCDFCVVPAAWGRKPFLKPVAHVIDDIRQNGGKRIIFYDLNLIANEAYAEALFTALIPLKVNWFGLATTLLAQNDRLLELVARSGCRGLLIGFESITQTSVRSMRKGFNQPEHYAAFIQRLHDAHIAINGTFVFGQDGEGSDAFDHTRDFVLDTKIDLPRFAVLTPFPGTRLYQRLEQEGRILTKDWSLYDGQHVVFQPEAMRPETLQQGHERVWREVYAVNGIRRRILRRMKHFPLALGANLAYRYYANNLHKVYTCSGGMA